MIQFYERIELEPVRLAMDCDSRGWRLIRCWASVAIAAKTINRPFVRRRKIALEVRRCGFHAEESLKARVPPQTFRLTRWPRRRNPQTRKVSVENISKSDRPIQGPAHACFDPVHGPAGCLRMT